MSEENSTKEKPSSQLLEEAYRDSKSVSFGELENLRTKLEPWTIVCITELMNRPYILLGKDDKEHQVWVEFNGETKEQLTAYFETVELGRQIYGKKARSPEELDYLRRIVISVSNLSELIHDNEFTTTIMQVCLNHIAIKWFRADHPEERTDEEIMSHEDFMGYVDMVVRYVDRLFKFVTNAKDCMTADNQQ